MYQFNVIHRKLDGTEMTKEEVIAIFKKRPAIEIEISRGESNVSSNSISSFIDSRLVSSL